MSGHGSEGSPPPEVPDEFAAAYRAAYERALAESGEGAAPEPQGAPPAHEAEEDYPDVPAQHVTSVGSHRGAHRAWHQETADNDVVEDDEYDDTDDGQDAEDSDDSDDTDGRGPVLGALAPQHARETPDADAEYAAGSRIERWQREPWFVPALLGLLVLVLVLGAYVVGRVVSADVKDTKGPTANPSVVLSESGSPTPSPSPSTKKKPSKTPSTTHVWQGPVHPAAIRDAQATCTAPPGVDSSGRPVGYRAANTIDADKATAWRCDGTAVGERLVFRLPSKTAVGQVGLVPGYAKTDPKSGADRYAENNRITRVRWILGDTSLEQTMSGNPADRSLRTLRIPKTSTDRIVLEILDVKRGPRNTTAISTVKIAATG